MPAAHAQWSRHGAELERLISRAQDTANLRTRFAITQRHYRRAVLALFTLWLFLDALFGPLLAPQSTSEIIDSTIWCASMRLLVRSLYSGRLRSL